jgi:hypothetical protein
MQQSRRRWRRKHSGAYCIVDLCNGTKPVQCRLINFSNGGACLYGFIDATTVLIASGCFCAIGTFWCGIAGRCGVTIEPSVFNLSPHRGNSC